MELFEGALSHVCARVAANLAVGQGGREGRERRRKEKSLGREMEPVALMLNRKTSRKIMAEEIAGDVNRSGWK